MKSRRHNQFKSRGPILRVAGAVLLALALPLRAGDPIKFSSTGKKLENPRQNPLEPYLSRPFDSLRPESSLGPVLPPAVPMSLQRPALPDRGARDRTKVENSWIWELPQNTGRQPTVDEMFNVRQLGPDGRPKKQLSLMEEYFQHRDQRNQNDSESKPAGNGFDREQNDSRRSTDRVNDNPRKGDSLENRERPLRAALETDNKRAWEQNSARNPLGSSDLTLSDLFKGMREDFKKERERDQRNQDFQQMLDNPNAWMQSDRKSLLEAPDPKQNLPAAMREMEDYNRANRRDVLSPGGLGGPGRSDLGPLGDPMPKLQLAPNPSAAPGLADPLKQRERPAVLPIPRRQF